MAVRRAFMSVLEEARLSRKSPVAVAVSGGCDSMVLLWMAKQAFTDLTSVTVDLRLCDGSGAEVARAGALAAALGVQHQVLSLEWDGSVGATYSRVRTRSCSTLLDFCKSSGLKTLMTAHHLDDQISTMLFRLSVGSVTSRLAGMCTVEESPADMDYLGIKLVHPFLSCQKEQLIAVCKEAGLEWVEHPTNSYAHSSNTHIQRLLEGDLTLRQSLYHMHSTLSLARSRAQEKAYNVLCRLVSIDNKYGYVSLNRESILELPKEILREVLSTLVKFVSADISPVRTNLLEELISDLPSFGPSTVAMLHNCYVFLSDQHTVSIAVAPAASAAMGLWKPVPIRLGKTLHWIDKWKVHLSPLSGTEPAAADRQYYVRPFSNKKDATLLKHGVRVIRGKRLPHIRMRGALPVVTDEEGKVVAMPHFLYNNRTYGIQVSVKHSPLLTLDYVHKCSSTPANHC